LHHRAADHAVHRRPGLAHFGRELVAQALLQRLDQRGADGGVVVVAHAVADVPPAQVAQHRHQRLGALQQADGRADHRHQALALHGHVAAEHPAQRGIALEQVVVEQRSGLGGDGLHEREAFADESELGGIHGGLSW
jgi:hypothetical protein